AGAAQRLAAFDPIVRLDADKVGVHQSRVAVRRLRSDLRTFRDQLDPEWATPLRDELRWLAGELGGVRDADVMLGRLAAAIDRLPEADALEVAPVLKRLSRERTVALAEVHVALNSERYLTLLDRVVEGARAPQFVGDSQQRADQALVGIV